LLNWQNWPKNWLILRCRLEGNLRLGPGARVPFSQKWTRAASEGNLD
jgi:hypothetical protein